MALGIIIWVAIIGTVIWIVRRCLPNNPATVSSLKSWNKMLMAKEQSDEDYWTAIEEIARTNLERDPGGYGLILQYVTQRKEKNLREYFLPVYEEPKD